MLNWFSIVFFFSSRRRHTRCSRDWSSDVCSSDLAAGRLAEGADGDDDGGRGGAGDCGGHRGVSPPLCRRDRRERSLGALPPVDRKSGVEGKSVDLGGRRIIKKKKEKNNKVDDG